MPYTPGIPHGKLKRGLCVYDPDSAKWIVTEQGTTMVPCLYVYHHNKTTFEQMNLPRAGWKNTIASGLWTAPNGWTDVRPYPPAYVQFGYPARVWIFTDLHTDRIFLSHADTEKGAKIQAEERGWRRRKGQWCLG